MISNQDELCQALEKAGHSVTQATLSRDMKELGIARVHSADRVRYVLNIESEERRLVPLIGYEIERIESNETMIVIKTLPGRAQGVAELIDGMRHPAILGTLAGDNTIFITPASVANIEDTLELIRGFTTSKKSEVA